MTPTRRLQGKIQGPRTVPKPNAFQGLVPQRRLDKSLTADGEAGRKGRGVTAKTQLGVGVWRTRRPRC